MTHEACAQQSANGHTWDMHICNKCPVKFQLPCKLVGGMMSSGKRLASVTWWRAVMLPLVMTFSHCNNPEAQ